MLARLAGRPLPPCENVFRTRRRLAEASSLVDGYAALLRSIPDPLFITDPDLVFVYINDAAAAMAGVRPDDVVGKRTCAEVFKADACAERCLIRRCMADRQPITGERADVQDSSGRAVPLLCSAAAVVTDDGEVLGGVEIFRDVTAQMEVADRARAAELQARNVLEGADALFIADTNLTITYMNEACARATGYRQEEVVGRMKCREVFRSSICDTACALKRCMASGETLSGARVTIHNRQGQPIPCMVTAAPTFDEKGNVTGGFEICRDITKEAEIEDSIRSAAEQLSSSSTELAAATEDAGRAADNVAGSIQGIAGEVEQVSKCSTEGAETAAGGQEKVRLTTETMARISEAMKTMLEGMRELNGRADEIGAITATIEDVAEQTNLLALNAAIEAARAGEHGKGFAVVASEVRKLAEQAADATGSIGELVRTVQRLIAERTSDTEQAASAANEGMSLAQDTADAFSGIADAVQNVDERARGAADGSQSVAAGAEQMTASMQEVAASAEELSALAEELSATAEKLGGEG
jgi:PAS domain S-box-containing protein